MLFLSFFSKGQINYVTALDSAQAYTTGYSPYSNMKILDSTDRIINMDFMLPNQIRIGAEFQTIGFQLLGLRTEYISPMGGYFSYMLGYSVINKDVFMTDMVLGVEFITFAHSCGKKQFVGVSPKKGVAFCPRLVLGVKNVAIYGTRALGVSNYWTPYAEFALSARATKAKNLEFGFKFSAQLIPVSYSDPQVKAMGNLSVHVAYVFDAYGDGVNKKKSKKSTNSCMLF